MRVRIYIALRHPSGRLVGWRALRATLPAVARVTTTTGTYRPTPLQFARLSDEEAVERSREFLARLSERRSVRQFSSEPVSHELIENAIRAAGTAPSGANQQPWTFVVVRDPEVKKRIRTAAEEEEYENYHGLLGHYHVQENKQDPGPAFQWDKVTNGARALMAHAAEPKLLIAGDAGPLH